MATFKKFAALLALLCVGAAAVAQGQTYTTVYQVLQSQPDLTILVQAIDAANLTSVLNSTTFSGTVFAPTNQAFVSLVFSLGLPSAGALLANTTLLVDTLLYHVVPGVIVTSRILPPSINGAPSQLATAGGSPLYVYYLNAWYRCYLQVQGLRNSAKVSREVLGAPLAIVNVIDDVLLPPFRFPNPVAAAQAAPRASFTVQAVISAGFAPTLSDPTFNGTIFLPTDWAWQKFAACLGILPQALLTPQYNQTLQTILSYHVSPGRAVISYDVNSYPPTVFPTLLDVGTNYQPLLGRQGPGCVQIWGCTNSANVVFANYLTPVSGAVQAVIHVIDEVLIPPGINVRYPTSNPWFGWNNYWTPIWRNGNGYWRKALA